MIRFFDFIFSLIGLVLLSPIVIVLLIIGYFDTGSPVFCQERVGKNKQPFNLYKFRSMHIATQSVATHLVHQQSVTPFGSFLRKSKLDELPQLFNVLLGDMSFVGPRPDVEGYYDKLEGENRKILELKPGITSEASLKYYNEETLLASKENPLQYNDTVIFPDKVRINLNYKAQQSLGLDLTILFFTLFKKKGQFLSL